MHGYVYRAYGVDGTLLYIGTSRNWGLRWAQHSYTAEFFALVRRLDIARYDTEDAARRVERSAIQIEHPPFNRRGILMQGRPRFSLAGLICPACGCQYDRASGALFGWVLGGICGDQPNTDPACQGRLTLA